MYVHTYLASHPFFGKFRTVFCSVSSDFHLSLTKMENTPLHFLEIFLFYSFIVFHCVVFIMLYAMHPPLQIFWLFPVFVTINNTAVNSFVHTYSCPAARLSPPPCWACMSFETQDSKDWHKDSKKWNCCQKVNSYGIFLSIDKFPYVGFVSATLHSYQNYVRLTVSTSLAKILCCQTKRSAYLIRKKCYLSILLICISLLENNSWFFSCG